MKKIAFLAWVFSTATVYGVDASSLCKDRITDLEKTVKANFSDERAWREYRVCVTELKRWHDGQMTAEAALKKNANNPEAHLMLGIAQLHSKNYTKASEALDDAIRLKPQNPSAYYYLGMAYLFQSMPLEASKAAERAVELDPNNAANQSQLAYAYYLIDEQEKCEVAAKRAIEIDPNNIAAYKVLGNLYTKQGKTADADRMFEEGIHANGRMSAASPKAAKAALPGMTTGVVAGTSGVAAAQVPETDNDTDGPEPAQSHDEVETRIIIQWRDMKEAILAGKIEKALSYYSDYEGTRERYRKAFEKMGPPRLKDVFSRFSDVEDCDVVLAVATCRASISSSGTIQVTKVRFEKNPDRVWRIRSY